MDTIEDVKSLLRRALAGESFALDRRYYSLHDLTQIAATLRPEAHLAIRGSEVMSPIERASIASVGKGRIVFV